MKRLMPVWVMFLFVATVLVCSASNAETITAMATAVNPEHLEETACYARVLGYNENRNTLTVELIVPEVFAAEDVLALEVGDAIYTGGEEILIRTIDWYKDDGYLVINAGAYEHAPGSVYLHEERWGNYMPDRYGHPTYNTLAVLECPVTDNLLFLDYISDGSGDALDLPIVHSAAALVEMIQSIEASRLTKGSYMVGLDIDNACVVFDGNGQLAVVQRFFVSWQ